MQKVKIKDQPDRKIE